MIEREYIRMMMNEWDSKHAKRERGWDDFFLNEHLRASGQVK